MSLLDTVLLFSIMLTLALVPSASVALVVTRSTTLDITNGMAVSLGIVLGDLVFIFLVIFGLSVVAETMSWLFLSIKYIGAGYLIWLGVTLLRKNTQTTVTISKPNEKGNIVTSLLAGFVLTLGDVKAIFFYLSLFPAFVDFERLTVVDILIIILITVVAVGGAKVFYAISARKLMVMSQGFSFELGIKKTAGSIMVGAGTYLIVKA